MPLQPGTYFGVITAIEAAGVGNDASPALVGEVWINGQPGPNPGQPVGLPNGESMPFTLFLAGRDGPNEAQRKLLAHLGWGGQPGTLAAFLASDHSQKVVQIKLDNKTANDGRVFLNVVGMGAPGATLGGAKRTAIDPQAAEAALGIGQPRNNYGAPQRPQYGGPPANPTAPRGQQPRGTPQA